jgi:hypothetical protein
MKLKGRIDPAVLNAVRAVNAATWNSSIPELITYRKVLMAAQDRRCVYCKRTVLRPELGHRELDHILPKSQTPSTGFDGVKAASNAKEDRRHTRGYLAFQYEPENLAVSCKRCNSFKGSFDSLVDRTHAPVAFPTQSQDYQWVHPHYDDYTDHIEIQQGLLYVAVVSSPKGLAVIHACGLDRAEELTKGVVESCLSSSRELVQEMLAMTINGDPIDSEAIARALYERYQVASWESIQRCLVELQGAVAAGSTSIAKAMQAISLELGQGEAIFPPKDQLKP